MEKKLIQINYSEIDFDAELYPRIQGHDPTRVQEYAQDIEQIEAAGKHMSINANKKLLDGRHRMLAYKKNANGQEDFQVQVWQYDVTSSLESFKLACYLQDKGKSLEKKDRESSAKKLYQLGHLKQQEIAKILSVSPGRVSQWLSKTIKDEKVRNKQKVYDLWLACHTQEEIAEEVGVTHQMISKWIQDFANSLTPKEFAKLNFQDEAFSPRLYSLWMTRKKSNEVSVFGNSEQEWLENLLYLYTNPFDIVVDPFAGGGSTIDICKKRGRRYYVSDRKPIVEREHEIRKHDIIDGLPSVPRWKDVKLVFLDPPYWKQAEGKYSHDSTDLANMPLEQFNQMLSGIILAFAKKLSGYGEAKYIALMIQSTQWNAPEKRYVDHIADMIRLIDLPIDMRIAVPYSTQQCTPQMVTWAKEQKKLLVITREIIMWEIT